MSLPESVDCLIVGGAAVGTACACSILNQLTPTERATYRLLIVDRVTALDRIPKEESRALAIHARALENIAECIDDPTTHAPGIRTRETVPLLDDIWQIPDKVKSASQAILERGLICQRAAIRLQGRRVPVIRNHFSLLDDTPFPYITCIPQRATEAILRARLGDLGAHVHGGWKLTRVDKVEPLADPDDRKLRCTLVHEKLGQQVVETRFLVGADGGHSTVRQLAGLSFPRHTYPGALLLGEVHVADKRWPWAYKDALDMHGQELTLIFGSRGFVLLVPKPNNGIRIAANFMPPGFDPNVEKKVSEGGGHVEGNQPAIKHLQWLLDQYAPTDKWIEGGEGDQQVPPNTITSCEWSSSFHIHKGIVPSFLDRKTDLIAVIGDAAHVHSPNGARGLNTGLEDATTLGSTMVQAYRLTTLPERTRLLRSWSDTRLQFGLSVLKDTNQFALMSAWTNPILVWIRALMFRLVGYMPGAVVKMMRTTAGLDSRPRRRPLTDSH